jgi:hypothetical protein
MWRGVRGTKLNVKVQGKQTNTRRAHERGINSPVWSARARLLLLIARRRLFLRAHGLEKGNRYLTFRTCRGPGGEGRRWT